ncbi:MAG TPA: pyridoxamine 5'-phosphate oxidase family protein [Acidimicrobiales bacterium]|nr:pyridoxamine 5'-phosphate oxidase family protein [Acidimicrobiales bacterium]
MNPAGWPHELLDVFERSLTVEFATLTRAGAPVTVPTTPYVGADGSTLDVSTGLTYPGKAERARRDPRVALLFADPIGKDLTALPVVVVQGLATVRDSDLQGNTDRYVRLNSTKLPEATKGQPKAALRRMVWYYARIWVEITPLHIRWWPDRDLSEPAQEWNAPEGTAAPLSDPAPPGARPGAWIAPPPSWRTVAEDALARLPLCDLTVVGANGFPLCLPAAGAELVDDGLRLRLGAGAPALAAGPACLTMHAHPELFTGQENRTLVGSVSPENGHAHFRVERALGDWSLAGNKLQVAVGFLSKGRVLRRRLRAEATRRAQPVPRVRFPSE